jgi:hypothetical protein
MLMILAVSAVGLLMLLLAAGLRHRERISAPRGHVCTLSPVEAFSTACNQGPQWARAIPPLEPHWQEWRRELVGTPML